MLESLKLEVTEMGIVVTRAPAELNAKFLEEVEEIGVPIVGIIPDDPTLLDFDMEKRSLMELADDDPSVAAVEEMLQEKCPA